MRLLEVLGVSLLAATCLAGDPAVTTRAQATFAGGCFWCMQPPFENLPGVLRTTVGYKGGHVRNPTYEQVSAGGTGHAEAIEIEYDPSKISYTRSGTPSTAGAAAATPGCGSSGDRTRRRHRDRRQTGHAAHPSL